MPVFKFFVPVAAIVALSACNSSDQPAAAATPAAAPAPAPLPTTIPTAFQGRWGLSADDCTAGAKAEGLLTVDADTLHFTESTAKLTAPVEASSDRFRGTFAFKGEGESRTTDEVFDVRDDGKTLVRREFGEGASMKPFTYTRCA